MYSRKPIDMVGKTFNHVTVLSLEEKRYPDGDRCWRCICGACSKEFLARGKDLRRGDYVSCGCLGRASRADRARHFKLSHGQHGTALYKKWKGMRQRCAHDIDYVRRGVVVCARWDDFAAFALDMGGSWKRGLSLERKDNNKGYEPGNCCWVPLREQARNRSSCQRVVYQGAELFLWRVAELLGIRKNTLSERYRKGLRPPELFKPPRIRET